VRRRELLIKKSIKVIKSRNLIKIEGKTDAELYEDFTRRVNDLYTISKYYEENNLKMPVWVEDKIIGMGELIEKLDILRRR